jgi:signal transduction histidine kinase
LTDAYPDGVVAGDPDGIAVVINRQAEALLGITAAECLGRPLAEVLPLQDQHGNTWWETNHPYDVLHIQRGVPEQSWINARGEEVLTTARIVRDERRGPVTGVAIALRHGRGRARLDRDRSDLVATLAHELRSPLTGVKGFVQVLLNRWDKLSDEQRKLMLTTVNADADRLTRLIAELLDVARIDTGRLSIYPREVSGEELARRVVESVGVSTSRPIDLRADERVPPVLADPDKLTQVLTNLVENGVRHGAGRVRVSVRAPAGEEFVRFIVEDAGDGIAHDLRRRVFTKFWTSGESAGSGLGLYIVGGLARAHDASVEIQDSELGGARIVVAWPIAHPDQ